MRLELSSLSREGLAGSVSLLQVRLTSPPVCACHLTPCVCLPPHPLCVLATSRPVCACHLTPCVCLPPHALCVLATSRPVCACHLTPCVCLPPHPLCVLATSRPVCACHLTPCVCLHVCVCICVGVSNKSHIAVCLYYFLQVCTLSLQSPAIGLRWKSTALTREQHTTHTTILYTCLHTMYNQAFPAIYIL